MSDPGDCRLGALYIILQGLLSLAIVLGPFIAIGDRADYVYKRVTDALASS